MSGENKRAVGQVLSATAVVLSLVFVGMEVRTNTKAVRGATMQAISDASSSFMAQMALDPEFSAVVARVFEGATQEEFSGGENQQLDMTLTRGVAGLGLGLAICKGIVEEHGGGISVEPAEGGGCIFSFTLPLGGAD